MPIHIDRLAIHPIKGFPPCPASTVTALRDHGISGDRQFAITHGRSEFEPQKSSWMHRKNFLNVALSPSLAALEAAWDFAAGRVSVRGPGEEAVEQALVEGPLSPGLSRLLEQGARGGQPPPYRLVTPADRSSLTDSSREGVSILSLSSLQDLSQWMKADLDVRRFRANLWVSDAQAWEEREWVGRRLTVGECVLEVIENIERCAAVDTEPGEGTRDVKVVKALHEHTGHRDFGVLAVVVQGGRMTTGDPILLT